MNILLIGKDGQLGKAFQSLFDALKFPHNVRIKYVGRAECELLDGDALLDLLEREKPNLIINASAYTAVDRAETEVDLAYAINAKVPERMALYASSHGATLLHYSTDYVFDGNKESFYVETDPRNPLGIYGKSKAAGEEAIERAFAKSGAGQFAIMRTSWVYGEGGNFIHTILRLAKEREVLKVIYDQHGVPTSAQWLAQVSLDLILDKNLHLQSFPSGIYHAVPSGDTTWYGLASLAVQAGLDAGAAMKTTPGSIQPIKAVEYPLPAPRPQNSRMNNTKLRLAIERSGDMSKLQHWNKPYEQSVRAYVAHLMKDGLI